MPFGVNPLTGRPGPPPKPARDGDRLQARQRVNVLVRTGRLPRPDSLTCVECKEPAREYDHHLGYAAVHHLDVEPVCRKCQRQRSIRRGEWKPPSWKGKKRPGQNDRRPRDPVTGKFKGE